MTPSESVTRWIDELKSGNAEAAQRLWERYFGRMVELARRKLEGTPRAAADEEDVALSAFKSFCIRARDGHFTQLIDSENLWPLLMAITAHKSVDHLRMGNRRKRGGTGRPADDRERPAPAPAPGAVPLSELISREPTPEFAAELSDHLERLLARLDATGDGELRKIALLKLEGHGNGDTADRLGCARRTVERKLQLIARLWGKDIEP